MDLDLEELAAVLELLQDADFTEFHLQKGDLSIVVSRGQPATTIAPAIPMGDGAAPSRPQLRQAEPAQRTLPTSHAAQPSAQPEEGEELITSTMLGTFYRSPKPSEPPFVEIGDTVEPDSPVCIIEVMKLMNSITAGVSGVITKIFAQDGQLVEADEPLFAVRANE